MQMTYQRGLKPPKSLESRGVFYATKDEIYEMCKADSETKMLGLAHAIAKMKTLAQRRAFIAGFQDQHGEEMTEKLKNYVLMVFEANKSASENSPD